MKLWVWLAGVWMLAGPVVAQTSVWANVRNISTTMDVASPAQGGLLTVGWAQAETVAWTHRATSGGQSFPLTASNALVVLEVVDADDLTTTELITTGTITAASSGQMRFDLTPTQSNLRTNDYRGYIRLFQTNGASVVNLGVLAQATITVDFSPSFTNYAFVGDSIAEIRSNAVVKIQLGAASETGGVSRTDSATGVVYTLSYPVGGGATNVGFGLAGNGKDVALAVDTNAIATTGHVAAAISGITAGLLTTSSAASTYATISQLSDTGAVLVAQIAAATGSIAVAQAGVNSNTVAIAGLTSSVAAVEGEVDLLQGYTNTVATLNAQNWLRNQSGTNLVLVAGGGVVASAATGTMQIGYGTAGATNVISAGANGAVQMSARQVQSPTAGSGAFINSGSEGAIQRYWINGGIIESGTNSSLAEQHIYISGTGAKAQLQNDSRLAYQRIMASLNTTTLGGDLALQWAFNPGGSLFQSADNSVVFARLYSSDNVTNLGEGAWQILSSRDALGYDAFTSAAGENSFMIGFGTATNRTALLVGDGAVSHKEGSVSAIGGFWGDVGGLTGTLSSTAIAFPDYLATTQYVGTVETALTARVVGTGEGATNLVFAMGEGATNFTLGAWATASNALAVATGAQAVAGAAVPWLGLTGAVHGVAVTNIGDAAFAGRPYMTFRSTTNAYGVILPSNTNGPFIGGSVAMQFETPSSTSYLYTVESAGVTNLIWRTQFAGPANARTIYHSGNFSPSSYRTVAEENAYNTNVVKVYPAAPLSNTQHGVVGELRHDVTNLYLFVPNGGGTGTNWLRVPGNFAW